MQPHEPARDLLAERAAHGLPVVPQLRLLCLAEALHAPAARRALDLNAELETLGTALQESVRRRTGWLSLALPGQPVAGRSPPPAFTDGSVVLGAQCSGMPHRPGCITAGYHPAGWHSGDARRSGAEPARRYPRPFIAAGRCLRRCRGAKRRHRALYCGGPPAAAPGSALVAGPGIHGTFVRPVQPAAGFFAGILCRNKRMTGAS